MTVSCARDVYGWARPKMTRPEAPDVVAPRTLARGLARTAW